MDKKYLWEIVQEKNKKNLKLEISNKCGINEVRENRKIDISHRFSHIFEEYIGYMKEGYFQKNEKEVKLIEIEDSILRSLGKLELIKGYSKKEIIKRKILEEIEKTINLDVFNTNEKDIIANYYYKMRDIREEWTIFIEVVEKIFKKIEKYEKEKSVSNKNVLLYIPEEKTEENMKKMEIIKDIFLDINIPVRVFWKNYFGKIGENRMMKINEIEIY